MNYMGIDHHKQYSHLTLMDEDGAVLKADKVWNVKREVEEFLKDAGGDIKAVIESGRSSYSMVDLLEELGIDVTIADPLQVKAIAKAKIKTDKRDSQILAHLLRADLIPEVYMRDRANRETQRVLRQRAFFVGTRTRVKNRIASLLAQQGEGVQRQINQLKDLFTKKAIERIKGLEMSGTDRELLEELFKIYWHLEERIKESDGLVDRLYKEMPEAKLIRTVPGFGKFFSVLVATEISEINRFGGPEKLHCYAGIIPSTHSSGERSYHGKIIKGGNKWLRWAAVEAVNSALRSDFDIKVFFEKQARRKSTNAARVATARRLLTIIYRILKERREYIPYKRAK